MSPRKPCHHRSLKTKKKTKKKKNRKKKKKHSRQSSETLPSSSQSSETSSSQHDPAIPPSRLSLRMHRKGLAKLSAEEPTASTSSERPPSKKRRLNTTTSTLQADNEFVTIKCGLKNVCANEIVFDRINADVKEVSDLMVEASLYAHFCINKDLANDTYLEKSREAKQKKT